MPDDPARTEHERQLQIALSEILKKFEIETLMLIESGQFSMGWIPTAYWSVMRQQIRDQIHPLIENLAMNASIRTADSLGQPLSATEVLEATRRSADRLSEKHATLMVLSIEKRVEEIREESESAGLALAIIIGAMLEPKPIEKLSIWMTTNGITAAERETANQIQAKLDQEHHRLRSQLATPDDQIEQILQGQGAQPTKQQKVQPANEQQLPPGHLVGQIKLVAIWRVQTNAAGRPDEKVCPICFPINGKPDHEWPEKYKDGPQAHHNCRCYTDWEFWMNGKPIASFN